MGRNVHDFEREVAACLGARHAVAVNSGTDAIMIGLNALGVGPGDEVITTPFTMAANAEAICRIGATPVFADVDERTFNIDAEAVRSQITSCTKAIVPVHLFGHPANMANLLGVAAEFGLKVVEDCAQAYGATIGDRHVGTFGHAGAFSCYPTKPLGAYGDAGFITTNDDELADLARVLRVHGARVRYRHDYVGYNSRLDEIQAAILRVKLPHAEEWTRARRQAAARYGAELANTPAIVPHEAPGVTHVYHQYTVRIQNGLRDGVLTRLNAAGIPARVFYNSLIPDCAAYRQETTALPRARRLTQEVLSLPIHPYLQNSDIDFIAAALGKALEL